MSSFADFKRSFDQQGRFLNEDGEVAVVFATQGGKRFPGKLRFKAGLCVHAEMTCGGEWGFPDDSPLHGVRFLLEFGDELSGIDVEEGRVIAARETSDRVRKRDFLINLRVARNLFGHHRVSTDSADIDTAKVERALARAAIWLTPRSVAGFKPADFSEIGSSRQRELQDAIQEFLAVVNVVPADQPATDEQLGAATVAFEKVLQILAPYLPSPDEGSKVEAAIRSISLPAWVVDWDYELSTDEAGDPAVRVDLFAENGAPSREFGRTFTHLVPELRSGLNRQGVNRWPYFSVRTVAEHKAG